MNLKRMLRMMLHDVLMQKKAILLVTLSVSVVLIFLGKLNSLGTYVMLLYWGGMILTGSSFADMHDSNRGCAYLTLPASRAEKFLTRWFLSSIGYAVFTLVLYSLLSVIVPNHGQLNAWFNGALLTLFMEYFVLQSLAFLGAVYFRRRVLIKTACALTVFFLGLFACVVVTGYSLFSAEDMVFAMTQFTQENLANMYTYFWFLLAPVSLGIAYIRFKEYEV